MAAIVIVFGLAILGSAGYNLAECHAKPNCQVSSAEIRQ